MFLFLAAATAAASADLTIGPIPNDPAAWVTGNDNKGHSGITAFRLLIDKKGKAYRCEITATSGSADLDRRTCGLALKRARFKPAKAGDGMPIASTYSTMVRWGSITPPDWARGSADMKLHVPELPPSYNGYFIWFFQTVGTGGKVLQCRAREATVSASLEDAACAALSEYAAPMTDAKGNETEFLIPWKVGLTTGNVPVRPPSGAVYTIGD